MFVIVVKYLVELAEIDAAIADHGAWLAEQYADGVFLASGRQVPRTGGVILAAGLTREDLDRRLAGDPFGQRGLAEYQVTEFVASRTSGELERFRA
ncbi:MAG: YciI family protein [Kineosporiaceae bacterium]